MLDGKGFLNIAGTEDIGISPSTENSAINTDSKQGERFSISDNPFVTERKAKSAANIFKALTLDELDSDVVDYLENKTPLYAELGGFVCLKMSIMSNEKAFS
ncbi:MAG: hypothetical protein MJZ15_10685 [Bacteroidales bacterium]|nr:hypothetical protein [Bacteroidales bacterium]